MGSAFVIETAHGKTKDEVEEVLVSLVTRAQREHGHGGYGGTLAGKSSGRYIDATPPGGVSTVEQAHDLIDQWLNYYNPHEATPVDYPLPKASDDKWEPINLLVVDGDEQALVFFGWASE